VLSVPNAVVLSERARAILQGFPEGWQFLGDTKKSRAGMIGMAMPPPMAEAVARSIVAWFAAWNARV
jgi:site-specific DNA-cytosine methylase